jgi:phosphopantetheinyl transferase
VTAAGAGRAPNDGGAPTTGRRPAPPPPAVHIYYADVGDFDAIDARYVITPADGERLARLRHPERRLQSLAGRALLRFALEDATGAPAESYEIETTEHGKPECVNGPAVSITHSGRFVACAISPAGNVGLDAEVPRSGRHIDSIATQYFSAAERAWLAAEPDERFRMLWVLKEAYLKASGLGLAGGLRSLECRVEPPLIEAAAAGRPAGSVTLALYSAGAAFVGLAATGHRIEHVEIKHWSPRGAAALPAPLRFVAMTS